MRPKIVLSSRELHPMVPTSVGVHAADLARTLAAVADVTVLTPAASEEPYRRLRAAGSPDVDYGGASVAFVADPSLDRRGSFHCDEHLYAHDVVERLRRLFGQAGPDLLVLAAHADEGFVAAQARAGGDPFFARTRFAALAGPTREQRAARNGFLSRDMPDRVARELERLTLDEVDALVVAGAEAPCIPHPWCSSPTEARGSGDGPLRVLHVGPYERSAGLEDLLGALTGLAGPWHLTLAGEDTPTAPLGLSMRRALELQAAGDPRITFEGRWTTPRSRRTSRSTTSSSRRPGSRGRRARWRRWRPGSPCSPAGTAAPTGSSSPGSPGGSPGSAAPTTSARRSSRSWPTLPARGPRRSPPRSARASRRSRPRRGPGRLPGARREPPAPDVAARAPAAPRHAWSSPTTARRASSPTRSPPWPPRPTSASSCSWSTTARFDPEDEVLLELRARFGFQVLLRPNGGLGAARNFGIAQSRGAYVLPLDADNVLEPTFVERCLAVLEADDDVAFVTSWNRYVDELGVPHPAPNEGYRPLGNRTPLVEEEGLAGDGTAVFRRSVFDHHRFGEELTSFEDWALFRSMHRAGRFGRVIPEMLWRYRVREDSMLRAVGMPNELRIREEIDALMIEQEMRWVSTNG